MSMSDYYGFRVESKGVMCLGKLLMTSDRSPILFSQVELIERNGYGRIFYIKTRLAILRLID